MNVHSKRSAARLAIAFAFVVCFVVTVTGQTQKAAKPELEVQVGHAFQISALDFNKDGMLASASWDNNIKLWDVNSGLVIRTLTGHKDFVYSVNFSRDGKTLASGSRDHTIKLWSLNTPDEPKTIQAPGEIQTVQFFPDGITVAGAGEDGIIRLWNTQSGDVETIPPRHRNYVYSLAISPNGRMLASSSVGEIKLWDFQTRKEQALQWCSNRVDPVVFSPDNKTLAAGCSEGTVLLWNLETGEQQTIRMHEHSINSLQFSTDGTTLGSAGGDGIKFYNLGTKQMSGVEGDTRRTEVISFSPDRQRLVSGDDEGGLKLWNLSSGKETRPGFLRGDPQRFPLANSAVFSPDGSTLAVGWANGSVTNWGLTLGAGAEGRIAHSETVNSVLFTPDSKFLITTSTHDKLKFWDLAAGGKPKEVDGYLYALTSEAFSSDKKLLATSSSEGIRLVDLSTFQSRLVKRLSDDVYSLSFSPDQKTLAVSRSNSVTLLDIESGRERLLHEDHGGVLSVVRFTRDGKAVQGQVDNTITIHDLVADTKPRILKGSNDWPARFVFDPEEKYLASLSGDRIMLWDLRTGAPIPVDESLPAWVRFDNLARFGCGDVLAVPGGNYVKLVRVVKGEGTEELLRIYGVAGDGWVAVAPDGRFDTNLPLEDLNDLNWLMPEAPLHPLPLELFMRDYYEPQLLPRILDADDFTELPDFTRLNRALPNVSITNVSQPDADRRITVTVAVAPADGDSTQALDCTKKPNRCAYDLRLYRDSHLVGSFPSGGAAETVQIPPGLSREDENEKWRAAMLVKPADCSPGSSPGALACKFDVQLPLGKNAAEVELTAYAFNDDRVKSLTAKWVWPQEAKSHLPPAVPVKPIVYVISFGVNSFDNRVWNLKFAAQDAQSMQKVVGERLRQRQQAGEFEKVVEVKLVSDGPVRLATKRNLRTVLELLAGKTPSRRDLFLLGPVARSLQKARPDDIVIVSLASHGYANKSNLFYILPSDIQGSDKRITPQLLQSAISSDELSLWVRNLDAEEFVMIIDACQAAAVVGKEFKAGPMGSRGLGQLAYDKGMRILAATRAEGEAMEVGRTRNGVVIEGGLLTYALLKNGIEEKMADYHPQDNEIGVDEWLSFAVTQVPHLYTGLKFLRNGRPAARTAAPGRAREDVQRPSLFNFKRGKQDTLLLRVP